jgi:hypothetical protein
LNDRRDRPLKAFLRAQIVSANVTLEEVRNAYRCAKLWRSTRMRRSCCSAVKPPARIVTTR